MIGSDKETVISAVRAIRTGVSNKFHTWLILKY